MAEFFFDPVNGSSGNPGTYTQPLATKEDLLAKMQSGNVLRWRAGTRMTLTWTQGFSITSKVMSSKCLILPYDDDLSQNKPLFDMLTYEAPDASGWTPLGDGRWQKDFKGQVFRIWDATTETSAMFGVFGNDKARASSAATVDSIHKFHGSSSSPFTVTMYTGTGTPPPAFFDGLALAGNAAGNTGGVIMRACTNIHWQDIRAFGGAGSWQVLSESGNANDSSDITFERCEASAVLPTGSAFHVRGADTSLVRSNVRISYLECVADNKRTPYGWEHNSSNWGSNNGFNVDGACRGVTIRNPVVKGFGHSEIQAQNDGTTSQRKIQGLHIYRTRRDMGYVDSSSTDYAHAFDVCADGYLIDGIDVTGQTGCSQFGGSGVVRNVSWRQSRESIEFPMSSGTQNAAGKNSCIMVQNFSSPDYREVTDITLSGVLIENPVNFALLINYMPSSPAAMQADAVKMVNSTIVDLIPTSGRAYSIQLRDDNSSAPTQPAHVFRNNLFISGLAHVFGNEEGSNANYVRYSENGYSGALGNLKFATAAAAGLDSNYRPTAASPAYRAGAGMFGSRDPDGTPRWNPPTVGRYEVVPVRAARP